METRELIKIIDNFKGKKIGVIGELMLDRFIYGKITRISPEAPVPVILIEKEVFMPGGAGNTAANIASLGGKVFLMGAVGKDFSGQKLIEEFKKIKIDTKGIIKYSRPTIEKTRVLVDSKHIFRVDKEEVKDISASEEKKIISFLSGNIKNLDAVVISDYAKGLITRNLAKEIINIAKKNKKPIIVDAKPKNISFYKGITLLKMNNREAVEVTKINDTNKSGKMIQKKVGCNILITRGGKGMSIFQKDKVDHLPSMAKKVIDVSGAGDTVVAAFSMSLASGADFKQATDMSSRIAGIAVGKPGTAVVYLREVKNNFLVK